MQLLKKDNKIQANAAGEIYNDIIASSKILHLDTDLQQPNRIHKNATNQASQITDKAQNLAFYQSTPANMPVFSYDGYFNFANGQYLSYGKPLSLPNEWTIFLKIQPNSASVTGTILGCDNQAGTREWALFWDNSQVYLYDGAKYDRVLDIALSLTEFNYIAISKRADGVVRAHNWGGNANHGYVRQNTGYTNGFTASVNDFYINRIVSNYYGDFKLGYAVIYEGILQYLFDATPNVTQITQPIMSQDFLYYKRYPNEDGSIKLFLSSPYLKGAVINSSDEITSIKDEIGNVYTSSGTNAVKWNKKGLYFQGSAYLQRTGFEIGTNDFFIGLHVNNDNTNDGNIYQNSGITIDKNSGNYRINGTVIAPASTNTYEYVHAFRYGGNLYLGLNGVLKGSTTDTNNYTLSDTIIGSNSFVGYIDDSLTSVGNSIYSSSGTIGKKDFQAPARRSLEPRFIQF